MNKGLDITENIIKYLEYEIDYYIYRYKTWINQQIKHKRNIEYESIYLDLCNKLNFVYDDLNDDEIFIAKNNYKMTNNLEEHIQTNIRLINILNRYIDNRYMIYKYI
jgi:hypothetical protein